MPISQFFLHFVIVYNQYNSIALQNNKEYDYLKEKNCISVITFNRI